MKIFVKVKPKAKENLIKKIDETHFKISVKALPEKGKANAAVIKILADYFNVPSSVVHLVSGYSFRQKIFKID